MAIILFPVGRMIGGSLAEMHARTENDGKTPKLDRDGKPMMACNFGVALPKQGETHWSQTSWGAEMFNIGKTAEPVLHQSAAFAWKVVDGDSALPNKNGKIPKDQEGYAGCWVLWFSQGWLPTLCNADGSVELPAGAIVPGQYIQVQGDVTSNGAKPPNTPGLYLNPRAVALVADGDRIISEKVDTKSVGFGGAPLPPGARPLEAAVPGFVPPPAAAPVAPVQVPPNPAFMTPPPPVPPAGPVMTAAANGASYEQMLAAGWTDATLRQHGMMM